MLHLAQNSVVQIETEELNGLYRVIAEDPRYPCTVLLRLRMAEDDPEKEAEPLLHVARTILEGFSERGQLRNIQLLPSTSHLQPAEKLSDYQKELYQKRLESMARFLDARELTRCLYLTGGVATLIKQAMCDTGCSRSYAYKLFRILCQYGFDAGSLTLEFPRCGGKGKKRPCDNGRRKSGPKPMAVRLGIQSEDPQPGYREEWAAKVYAANAKIPNPKPGHKDRYQLIIRAFSPGYRQTDNGLELAPPIRGTYPNRGQVRRLLKQLPKLERLKERTTAGHFTRNMRGLHGRSWEGVAGPGHSYAMDSTIGDIYLRSQVNRAWIIGRPIIYFIVDVWSTAIVGFYVCLSGPSWDMAKVAIFSMLAPGDLMQRIWGAEGDMSSLYPFPGLPYLILGDRGEYLSAGARATGTGLGFNYDYAASYRPDMKGIVEVLHRIAKDQQYFHVPGAMDARRKEMELRGCKTASAYTLPEYVQYLTWRVQLYNLQADRSHRMDTTMIGAGVYPSPAGLWRFGFEAGIGYRKETVTEKLITHLLPKYTGRIQRDGIFLGNLEYHNELAQAEEWTTLARHDGRMELAMHLFPGSIRQAWTPHPHGKGLLELMLSDQAVAPGNLTLDEVADAKVNLTLTRADREHEAISQAFAALQRIDAQAKRAVAMTTEAERVHRDKRPTITEARQVEIDCHGDGLSFTKIPSVEPSADQTILTLEDEMQSRNIQYAGLMDQILGGL